MNYNQLINQYKKDIIKQDTNIFILELNKTVTMKEIDLDESSLSHCIYSSCTFIVKKGWMEWLN